MGNENAIAPTAGSTSSRSDLDSLAREIVAYSPECVKILDVDGRLLDMNENGRVLLGIDDLESVRGSYWPDFWQGADREDALAAVAAARDGGAARFMGFFTTSHGEPKWWDVVVSALPGEGDAPARLLAVSRDITDQRRSEGYFRFLADIGAMLQGSLDSEATLEDVADAISRNVADYCAIELLGEDGIARRVAYAHRGGETSVGAARILAMDATADLSVRADDAREGAPTTYTSFAAAPMMHGGTSIGRLCVAASGRRFAFDERDVALVTEIGRRVASWLVSARRYERELHVATTLQAAAIPHRLPVVAGVTFDAIYVPASSEATVGGDWYDAFELTDGRIVMTIGDVMGHGIDAAVTMGAIRQSMRAAAMMQADPTRILDIADRTLRMDDPHALATALVAVVDVRAGSLSCALAGHPAPILRRADGHVSVPFASGGLMLGMRMSPEPQMQTIDLRDGDLVVFVTDGILEQSRDIRSGERALVEAMRSESVYGTVRPARALHEALGRAESTDDVAILTMAIGLGNRRL